MIVIIALGLIVSLGAGAIFAFAVPAGVLPAFLTTRCGYANCACSYTVTHYLMDASFYAFIFMTFFMIIALIVAIISRIHKKRAAANKPQFEKLTDAANTDTTPAKNASESTPAGVLEQEIAKIKSLLNEVLQEAMDKNETLPLLKKQNQEAEEAKTRLAVSLKEKCSKLTELSIENERLEKNNSALRKVIDDALDPYCSKQSYKTGDYQDSEHRYNDYRPTGARPPYNPHHNHNPHFPPHHHPTGHEEEQ